MFLDILELKIKNKKGKTVMKMWSQKLTKNFFFCTYNPPKIRNAFMFVDTSLFFDKSETTFLKHFFFVIYALKCLETCVNGVTNCATAEFYPLEVQILKIIFLKYFYRQFNLLLHKSETT